MNIPKTGAGSDGRRSIGWAVFRAQQKDCHLRASDRTIRTVDATPATSRDPFCRQLLDPGSSPVVKVHIGKASGKSYCRRILRRAMNAAFEEDCHLGAGNARFRTVPEGIHSTTTSDTS